MLPKSLRLPHHLGRAVLKNGKKISGNAFDLHYLPSSSNQSQWLILVPKKQAAKAHDRHRIRRVVGETIWKTRNLLTLPIQAVIKYKKSATAGDTESSLTELPELLKRI